MLAEPNLITVECFFFFNDTATTEIYTLSLHDALPIWGERVRRAAHWLLERDAVHVLATDAHDTEKRTPVLSTARDAIAEIYGDEVAQALVEGNPRAIIHAQPL